MLMVVPASIVGLDVGRDGDWDVGTFVGVRQKGSVKRRECEFRLWVRFQFLPSALLQPRRAASMVRRLEGRLGVDGGGRVDGLGGDRETAVVVAGSGRCFGGSLHK